MSDWSEKHPLTKCVVGFLVLQERVGKEWLQNLVMLEKGLQESLQSLNALSDLW